MIFIKQAILILFAITMIFVLSARNQDSLETLGSSQKEQVLQTIYLYENDPEVVRVSLFGLDGKKKSTYDIDGRPNSDPIICSENGKLYFACNEGIKSTRMNTPSSETVVEKEVSHLSIVGNTIYYITGRRKSDGKLYSCDLDGQNQKIVFFDPQTIYGKDDTVQNVSFYVDKDEIYYVAKESESEHAGIIKVYNMKTKQTENLYSVDANVQILGLCENKLYYQMRTRRVANNKTLMVLDLLTKKTDYISGIHGVAISANKVYYCDNNSSAIFEYSDGRSENICNIKASQVFIYDNKLYSTFAGGVPYDVIDLASNELSAMPDGFYGTFLAVSQRDKTAANIIDSIM